MRALIVDDERLARAELSKGRSVLRIHSETDAPPPDPKLERRFRELCDAIRTRDPRGDHRSGALGSPKSVKLAPEAQRLADASGRLAPQVARFREQRNYGEALTLIATLRPVVDAFFDKVMVLDPDEKIRGAHLGLIDEVLRNFSGIADFSEIVTS